MFQSDLLTRIDGINHGFFTREGGVSSGLYASLNCGFGSDDRRADVAENRNRIAKRLGVGENHLITTRQFHSAEVVTARKPWGIDRSPRADAIVTSEKNLAIAVLAADCTPVLFADPVASVIAAAHAGWRGALAGVLRETITRMEELGARRSRIIAAIGPTLSQAAYEVGFDFRDNFLDESPENACFFGQGSTDKPYFDLPGYIATQLREAGVEAIEDIGQCTYENESLFFSYRRSVHRCEADYGRQMSVVSLK